MWGQKIPNPTHSVNNFVKMTRKRVIILIIFGKQIPTGKYIFKSYGLIRDWWKHTGV